RLVVLDDPTAPLHGETEASLLRALHEEGLQRTLLLITHRLATAALCDTIYVLDQGQVVEQGTHAELVQAGGLYHRLSREAGIRSAGEGRGKAEEGLGP